ncbi:MAG: conjugal transfer protein [Bacteroidaceae bacterium]|nr:conjugal transfer protein [Bacteroidaceae bacterium]
MNIAYLISAHTDAPQLKRLIEALHTDAQFFVHIDKKSDISQFKNIIKQHNVHFLENRIDVRWGTILEVEYQMELIKAAIEYPIYFDRIFFLSGMDFPLWSNERILDFLDHNRDREFIQGICMDTNDIQHQQTEMYSISRPFINHKNLSNKWNMRLGILMRKFHKLRGKRKPLEFVVTPDIQDKSCFLPQPELWRLYKGSAWWCISEDLAKYIFNIYKKCPEVKEYFKDSFGSAETLIQTIVFNTHEWASKSILSKGAYPGLPALTPLHYIVYDPVIKIMDETDYDKLIDSGKMFARKFVSGKSDKLVEMLKKKNGE